MRDVDQAPAVNMPMMTVYFTVVFLLTWALWLAANMFSTPVLQPLLFYLGVFMPAIVALAMTYRARGAAGVQQLLKKLVKIDVGARWFLFALLFMASVKLFAAIIIRLTTGNWPVFGAEPVPLMFGAAILSTLLGGQVGEELGWRGFALPHLSRSMGLGPASIMLGTIWAAWHLPLFFIFGGDTVGQSFPFYLLQVIAISVAIAWVYMKSNGSLLITMLLHAAVNNTKDIVPSAVPGASNPWLLHASPVGWLTLTILWACAAWFLFDMRRDSTVARLTVVR
jgi:membrane protease YdiL (CAAX protease family)